MNKVLVCCCFVFLLFAESCKKNTVDASSDFFPPKQVSTNVNLLLAQFSNLNNLQGYAYLPGEGNRGIIIYHTTDDKFVAFDRTCPVNATTSSCAYVTVDSSATFFRCGDYKSGWKPCCNSRFDPSTGTPFQGEAKRPLKAYYTARQDNIIYISSTPF